MVYIFPRFYNCSVPPGFLDDLPQLAQLCEGSKPPMSSDKRVDHLMSVGGEKFVSFVKSERFVDGEMLPVYFDFPRPIFLRNPLTYSNPSLAVIQISTQAGWLRSWMPTCWWRPGREKTTSCLPTAPCPNMPWTSRGYGFPDQSCSSRTTTIQSGVCQRHMTNSWPA